LRGRGAGASQAKTMRLCHAILEGGSGGTKREWGEILPIFYDFLGNDVLIEIIKIEVIHITEWGKVWEGILHW